MTTVSPATSVLPPKSTVILPSGFTGAVSLLPSGKVTIAVKVVPAGIGVLSVTAPVISVAPARIGSTTGAATT